MPVILLALLLISLGIYSYRLSKGAVNIASSKENLPAEEKSVISRPVKELSPMVPKVKTVSELTSEAKIDLANRFKIKQEEITIKEVEDIVWNDSSLGCPEPGKFYAQVLTDGFKILLEAKGKAYDYRTSLDYVKFCPEKL